MSDALISAHNLCRSYALNGQTVSVLEGVDLSLNRGEFVAIVGASGSGKTTLLNILGTLDEPTDGSVHFGERDLFAMASAERARFRNQKLGFIFQFNQLLPEFTALENAAMPLLLRGDRNAHDKARELLQRVGLETRLGHRPGELSGGEQQRVAIARALIAGPSLVLADEPTGNLDRHTGDGVFGMLAEVCTDFGASVLMVTHNDELAARCTRVLRMTDGRLDPA